MVALQTAEESGSKAPSCTTHGKPAPLLAHVAGAAHANDKINYKDKLQSTIILTKSYYTKNPLF